uniref:Uncharacterized protein n=1 Tax=uncultured marine virus TaxID=186617 RepID=A0A0F7L613_9VIRU|nr:hypothetical protein [uncultured marine virus]
MTMFYLVFTFLDEFTTLRTLSAISKLPCLIYSECRNEAILSFSLFFFINLLCSPLNELGLGY